MDRMDRNEYGSNDEDDDILTVECNVREAGQTSECVKTETRAPNKARCPGGVKAGQTKQAPQLFSLLLGGERLSV